MRDALYASKIMSYAQGMVQLGRASQLYDWDLNFGDIASIWRGGCIIRARFLNRITDAYRKNPEPREPHARPVLHRGAAAQPARLAQAPCRPPSSTASPRRRSASALSYFDSYRSARLPANLLQAQRDFFGAHTYERVDKPGIFHADWYS